VVVSVAHFAETQKNELSGDNYRSATQRRSPLHTVGQRRLQSQCLTENGIQVRRLVLCTVKLLSQTREAHGVGKQVEDRVCKCCARRICARNDGNCRLIHERLCIERSVWPLAVFVQLRRISIGRREKIGGFTYKIVEQIAELAPVAHSRLHDISRRVEERLHACRREAQRDWTHPRQRS
jgi:hypothetical protein